MNFRTSDTFSPQKALHCTLHFFGTYDKWSGLLMKLMGQDY
jgi:hypothetical protein